MYQYRYIIHSNEKTWPSVDRGAGWIILTPTGCNLNRTIDTARCETDSEQYKEIIRLYGKFFQCLEFFRLVVMKPLILANK
jgi:hypothetical protein